MEKARFGAIAAASRTIGLMKSSYSQIPGNSKPGLLARLFRRKKMAVVSNLRMPDVALVEAIHDRVDTEGLLGESTAEGLGKLVDHHPGTRVNFWVQRLLLEWFFGRYAVHQLEAYGLLTEHGWECSSGTHLAASADGTISLPRVLSLAPSYLKETLHYKLYGKWFDSSPGQKSPLLSPDVLLNTDASINFWLPESVLHCIDDLRHELDLTRSDIVRNTLFLHLYGRVFYEDCLTQGHWKTKWREYDGGIMFSRKSQSSVAEDPTPPNPEKPKKEPAPRTAFVAAYGKSRESIKIWLAPLMREHLELMANENSLNLADYVRRTLTSDLVEQHV